MPSPLVIVFALIVCGFAASFLARWLSRGALDIARTSTCVLVLLGSAVLCYVNSFGNGFVWDDAFLIVDNNSIRNWHHWTQAFATDLYNNPLTQAYYYRPLQQLSYRLDYSLWGLHPDGYHALNILLHAANAILVFLLVRRFSQSAALGLACGALYVVHPIHTQAITYISGRADPMCAFFLLLALWFYENARAGGSPVLAVSTSSQEGRDREIAGMSATRFWYVPSLLAYAAALCSKEFAIFFPALLVLLEVCIPPREGGRFQWKGLVRIVPFVLLIGGYWAVRRHVFGNSSPPPSDIKTGLAPLVLCLRALAAYFSLLIAPLNLHMEQNVAFEGWKGTQLTITGCFGLAALIALIVIYWRRSRVTAFALLWFALFFLPISNLWRLNASLAEHWMYFPSIGFIWAAVTIGYDLSGRWRRTAERSTAAATTIVVFFVLALTARTILRNLDWRNEISFYAQTIAAGGGSPRVHNNLGRALVDQRHDLDGAEREYREALKQDPNYDASLNNLGMLYVQKKEYAKALPLFAQTLKVHPWRVEGYINLATTLWDLGRTNDTWKTFQDAMDRFPQSDSLALRYGVFALEHGEFEQSAKVLQHGQQLNPESATFANALGGLYVQQGKAEGAIASLNRAKQLDRFLTSPYVNLACLYQREGRYAEAERELLGALKLEPYNAEYKYRLGVLYWQAGQNHDANRVLNEVLQMVPGFAPAKEALQKVQAALPYGAGTTGSVIDLQLQPQGLPPPAPKKAGN